MWRDGEGLAVLQCRHQVARHRLVGAVVVVVGAIGVVETLRLLLAHRAPHHQLVAHEIGEQRALGAGDVPAPLAQTHMAVGVEGELHAVAVFHQRGLVVGDVHVGVEGVIGARPAGVAHRIGGRAIAVAALDVLAPGVEDAPPAEARDTRRPRAGEAAEDVEVVADLVEIERAAPFLLAPPVAREIAAMLRRQMFGRVHRDDLAQRAAVGARDGLAHDRHGAHDQANEQRRRFRIGKVAGECEGLVLGAHDRLLGEDRIAGCEGREQMFVVQMVGRADHYQVERPILQQRLRVGMGLAHRDVEIFQDRRANRCGVDVAGQVDVPAHLLHRAQHMRDALAEPDDADPCGFHAMSPCHRHHP